jgi:hypothetical protein
VNGLVLHCGAHAAEFDAVRAVATPEATPSWRPIPHADLYGRVRTTLESNGLNVVEEAHGLWSGGMRYFGLMQVRSGDNADDFGLLIGLRNSHDKSFPAALALGSRVFVCDNLAFSGEVKLSRKHTTHIWRDLPGLVDRAVGRLADLRNLQAQRIEAYKASPLTDDRVAHDLVVRSVYARALPGSQVMDVVNEWRQPRHAEFQPRTIWSLFNAFTEALKGSLTLLPSRTQALHGLLDSHVGLLTGKPVDGSDETRMEIAA